VSIEASEAAEARHVSGITDEPHSYDFLMYADLQSGRDADAKAVFEKIPSVLDRIEAMQGMGNTHMPGMAGRYRSSFPAFYALERRDWQSAAALEPVAGALPESEATTWWARAIADGHLHRAAQAQADLEHFDALMDKERKDGRAFNADSTASRISRGEIAAWAAFAAEKNDKALQEMRTAADLQDKVGQGEVDIPAREMLGDLLLELHQPQQALAEYRVALRLSPNRFNGLYHAGMAAEQAGDKTAASGFYTALLHATGDGAHSSRVELEHAKSFLSAAQGQ
jgi:tetratricopeptide (TPR) repeat protein